MDLRVRPESFYKYEVSIPRKLVGFTFSKYLNLQISLQLPFSLQINQLKLGKNIILNSKYLHILSN